MLLMVSCVASFAQQRGGWTPLFDGRSLSGWTWSTEANPPQPSWAVENGVLRTTPGKGKETYLLTRESFSDFELSFEWKAEASANSGVKYRFQGYWVGEPGAGKLSSAPGGPGRIEPVALEYQIADDEKNSDAVSDPKHATAAIYEYRAANKPAPARANVWHEGRIVARGPHIEHWLDGVKVVDVSLDSPDMQQAFQSSRRRGSSPILAKHERRSSPIALQFHDGDVRFRNIRIRRLAN
jgi:hypothetical protein